MYLTEKVDIFWHHFIIMQKKITTFRIALGPANV